MSEAYPLASMGQFLSHRKEFFQLDDAAEYQLVTVQLHGRGVRERTQLLGKAIKTKRQQRVRAGELLVAEIDAKAGGFGVVPDHLDGAIVSSHYFLYKIDETVIERAYLDYYLRSGRPEFDIQTFVQGSLNYAAIRPHHFPELSIPLPPLDEQRRIVAKLDALRARVEQALALQAAAEEDMRGLLLSAFARITADAPMRPMAEIAPLVRRVVKIEPDVMYPELGLRSYGKGTFHKPAIQGSELGGKRIYRIEAGDVVFSNVFSWEGAVAVAKPEDHGRYGSHRYISRVPVAGVITPQFLYFYFTTEAGLEQLRQASPGSAGRNRTLGLGALDAIKAPVPDYQQQLWFGELFARVEALRTRQANVQQELEAMLPAALDRAFRGEL